MHRRRHGLDEAGLRKPPHRGRSLGVLRSLTREPASASPALLDLQQHFEAVELLTKLPRVTEKIAHGAPIAHRWFRSVRISDKPPRRPGPDLRPHEPTTQAASTREAISRNVQPFSVQDTSGRCRRRPDRSLRPARPLRRPALLRSACRTAPCSGAGGAGAKRPARCGRGQWSSRAPDRRRASAWSHPAHHSDATSPRRRGRT